jgi:hypothetical protein
MAAYYGDQVNGFLSSSGRFNSTCSTINEAVHNGTDKSVDELFTPVAGRSMDKNRANSNEAEDSSILSSAMSLKFLDMSIATDVDHLDPSGNEDSAWKLLDAKWEPFTTTHRELSIPFLMWTLQRTIFGRDEERQEFLVKSLVDWAGDPQSPLTPRTILLLRSTIPGEFFNNDTTLDHKLDERLLNVLNKGLAPPEAEEEKGGKGEGQRGKEGHLFEKDETLSLSPSLSHKERPYFSPWTPIQAATTGAAPIDEKRAARSVG